MGSMSGSQIGNAFGIRWRSKVTAVLIEGPGASFSGTVLVLPGAEPRSVWVPENNCWADWILGRATARRRGSNSFRDLVSPGCGWWLAGRFSLDGQAGGLYRRRSSSPRLACRACGATAHLGPAWVTTRTHARRSAREPVLDLSARVARLDVQDNRLACTSTTSPPTR